MRIAAENLTFTYNKKSKFAVDALKNVSLTDFDTVAKIAAETGYITEDDIQRLIAFRNNPSDESWIK